MSGSQNLTLSMVDVARVLRRNARYDPITDTSSVMLDVGVSVPCDGDVYTVEQRLAEALTAYFTDDERVREKISAGARVAAGFPEYKKRAFHGSRRGDTE